MKALNIYVESSSTHQKAKLGKDRLTPTKKKPVNPANSVLRYLSYIFEQTFPNW